MSNPNRPESKTSRPNASTLIALLATLTLLFTPVSMAKPADEGPAADLPGIFELIADLYETVGKLVANASVVIDPLGRPDTSDGPDRPVATEAEAAPTRPAPGQTEGGVVIDPLG